MLKTVLFTALVLTAVPAAAQNAPAKDSTSASLSMSCNKTGVCKYELNNLGTMTPAAAQKFCLMLAPGATSNSDIQRLLSPYGVYSWTPNFGTRLLKKQQPSSYDVEHCRDAVIAAFAASV